MKMPKKLKFEDGIVKAKFLIRTVEMPQRSIKEVHLARVASLVDEIGVTLIASQTIFFTDAVPGFQCIVDGLGFDRILGADWYERAENGERITYKVS